MNVVAKYILLLNLSLALVSLGGSFWVARTVGSQAYIAGALATLVVGVSASFALLMTCNHAKRQQSEQDNKNQSGVSGVLLAMFIRLGLPIVAVIFVQQTRSPLIEAGFLGLLAINYLVALTLETFLSLKFMRETHA